MVDGLSGDALGELPEGLPGEAREYIDRLNAQLHKLSAEKRAIEQERDNAMRKWRSTVRAREVAQGKWKSAERDLEAIRQRLVAALSSHEVIHLGALGDAHLLCVLSRSPLFEVLLVQVDNRLACVKRKMRQMSARSGRKESPEGRRRGGPSIRSSHRSGDEKTVFRARWSTVFSRLISLQESTGRQLDRPDRDSISDGLLESEFATIAATQGAWNHQVIDLVTLGDGHRALVTPFHQGYRFNDFSRDTQRELFPRMLPALWNALAATPHGDLHPENVIVQPQRGRFVLIDPCAYAQQEPSGAQDKGNLAFTTCPANYPLLAPYYEPAATLTEGLPLAAHVEQFSQWVAKGAMKEAAERWPEMRLGQHSAVTVEPHPADVLAIGIIYYQILTRRHPFYDDEFSAPAWLHCETSDSPVTGFDAARARIERPIARPSDFDPSITAAEDALALSLLQLQVTTREDLIAQVKELGL